jgi:hypothetical protein
VKIHTAAIVCTFTKSHLLEIILITFGDSGHHWVDRPATCHRPNDWDLLEFVRLRNMWITLQDHEIGELADRD